MNVILLGATKFSEEILKHLLLNNIKVSSIFTIPEEFNISYSNSKVKNYNYAELKVIGEKEKIPVYIVDSKQGKRLNDYYHIIKEISPDVILVMGWYYMVPKKIRDLSKYGAWGIHASLLPKYAGGAPLVWAIINGEKETGVSLFRLNDGVDDGDLIVQKKIIIKDIDSIKEVYQKAIKISKLIVVNTLNDINNVVFKPQNKKLIEIWPQRKPEDGEIDLSKSAYELYNFVRAQSSPYPGAFIRTKDGKKLIIEKTRIEE